MLDYKTEVWDSLKREFTDCRLDTYFNVLRAVGIDTNRYEFLVVSMPMNGVLKYLGLKIKNQLVNCPIYECIDEEFGNRVLDRYALKKTDYRFDTIEEEIEFIKCNVKKRPIIVELIGMYLDSKLDDKQKRQKLGNLSTVCVVDYDEENQYFVLGLRDVLSGEQIKISLKDFVMARKNIIYPFSPCKYLRVVEQYEKKEKYTYEVLHTFFEQQMRILHQNNSLEMLLGSIQNDMKKVHRKDRNVLNIQCNVLHSSFCLGSNSFLYYEYADSIKKYEFWCARNLDTMEKAGIIIKKATREFAKYRDVNEFKGIEVLEQALSEVISLKQKVCEEWQNEKME